MQIRKLLIPVAILTAGLSLAGCNIGMAPSGMSNEEARSALDKLSPEQKIRYYASSPMPESEKQKKYAEIEQKYGIKAQDVLGGKPRTGG